MIDGLRFDAEDIGIVQAHNWLVHMDKRSGVVSVRANLSRSGGKRTCVSLHRLILGLSSGQKAIPRDGDWLNCCKINWSVSEKLGSIDCAHCGNKIERKRVSEDKYCSFSCAVAGRKPRPRVWIRRRKLYPPHACARCGKETQNKTVCSKTCKGDPERKRRIKIEAWQRYKARKVNQTPPDVDIKELQRIYLECPEGHEVDHIIPISKGGLHHPDNLQYLTVSENRKKSSKILTMWPNVQAGDCNSLQVG